MFFASNEKKKSTCRQMKERKENLFKWVVIIRDVTIFLLGWTLSSSSWSMTTTTTTHWWFSGHSCRIMIRHRSSSAELPLLVIILFKSQFSTSFSHFPTFSQLPKKQKQKKINLSQTRHLIVRQRLREKER